MSESISVCLLGYPCAEIVSPGPDRGEEVLCDASERAVRSHQVCDSCESCDQKYDEHGQDAVSENFLLRRPAESLLVTFSPAFKAMRDNILEYSHRADYRAVNSAERMVIRIKTTTTVTLRARTAGRNWIFASQPNRRVDRPEKSTNSNVHSMNTILAVMMRIFLTYTSSI